MTDKAHLILASSSPRRRDILQRLGLHLEIRNPDIPERQLPDEGPVEYAGRTAREKAFAVGESVEERLEHLWVLGADTVVVVDENSLGKPRDDAHARRMLSELSGREHQVVTGWFLYNEKLGEQRSGVEVTQVRFKDLRDEEIESYVETGEGRDKAGAYAIQGIGCFLVERIEGNYENVVGLPAAPLIEAMLALGILGSFPLKSDGGSIQ